jgi:hypothetical protein
VPVPSSFDTATATQDWAGAGREIECPVVRPGEEAIKSPHPRRQMLLKVNGWTFSAVWGFGTYCTAARPAGLPLDAPPEESPDAEIAAWRDEGPMIDLHGDTVEGWVSPASLLAAISAAELDDEAGIRAALARSEVA